MISRADWMMRYAAQLKSSPVTAGNLTRARPHISPRLTPDSPGSCRKKFTTACTRPRSRRTAPLIDIAALLLLFEFQITLLLLRQLDTLPSTREQEPLDVPHYINLHPLVL